MSKESGDGLDEIRQEGQDLGGATAGAGQPGSPPGAPGAPGGPVAPPPGQLFTEAELIEAAKWAVLPMVFQSIVVPALPELSTVYTPAFCDAWGKAMIPLCRKYSWSFDDSLGPWAGVGALTIAAAVPTAQAVMKRRAAAKAAEDAKKGKPPADTVTVTDTVTGTAHPGPAVP